MDPKELVSRFESLGDNCEFGVVQRYMGIEPLGLFRWNSTPLPALLAVLDAELENIDPERIEFFTEKNGEYMVRVPPWSFQYHTHQKQGSVELELLRKQQVKVLTFLKRKALDDLRSGEKIFVRKGSDSRTIEDAIELHKRLRRFGPNTLLWVVPEDDQRRAGTVEVRGEGLLKGYIDRFAPIDEAYDSSPVWLDLCRHALGLHYAGTLPGAVAARDRGWATNLLRHVHVEKDSGWFALPDVACRKLDGEEPLAPRTPVIEHRLNRTTEPASGSVCGYTVGNGLAEGAVYSGSFYVRIPEDARVRNVGAVLRGVPSMALANADLSLRGVWQRVWVSGRVPAGQERATLSLFVLGEEGTSLQTTCWQIETGLTPTPYVPSTFGTMRDDFRIRVIPGQGFQ